MTGRLTGIEPDENSKQGEKETFSDRWALESLSKKNHVQRLPGEFFFEIFFKSPFAALITKVSDDTIIHLNAAFAKLTGYRKKDLVGQSTIDMNLWANLDDRDKIFKILAQNGVIHNMEIEILHASGETRTCLYSADAIEFRGETYIFSKAIDITEQKRAEKALQSARSELETRIEERTAALRDALEALQESEDFNSSLLTHAPNPILVINPDTSIRYVNPALEKISGFSSDELIGRRAPYPWWTEDTMHKTQEDFNKTIHTGARKVEEQFQKKDGDLYWVEITSIPITSKGEFKYYLSNWVDTTERKRAEEHIHILTQQLMKTQENERQSISRELHDRVGQDLSMLKIGIDTLFDGGMKVPDEIARKISEFSKILQQSVTAVRDLAYDLRPPILDQLGLVRTIFRHCEDFSLKTGLKVNFNVAGMENLDLDFDTEINLYRLVQESLNNIHKHADARQVTIRMVSSFPNIILRIEDDGKGFDVQNRLIAASYEKRLGLRIMEERVNLLGGKIRIHSLPMEGTKIYIEVPCREKPVGR